MKLTRQELSALYKEHGIRKKKVKQIPHNKINYLSPNNPDFIIMKQKLLDLNADGYEIFLAD